MFALEINFQDSVSQSEVIFVRRPQALIGSSEQAHVVIDDMKELRYQLKIARELGRKFRCIPIASGDQAVMPKFIENICDGEAFLDLGKTRLHITALDSDLLVRETEPPDRAGVRVLRQTFAAPSPLFPAAVVQGAIPLVVSFVPGQPIYIGRSKECALRLDAGDISAKHARMGYEAGEFWVEDLGSTNGTFVNQQQVSGRVNVKPGTGVVVGSETSIVGVTSEAQTEQALRPASRGVSRSAVPEQKFPVIVSLSEVVRPPRFVLRPGTSAVIGRDPTSDVWLGAPHVSRRHCSVGMAKTGALSVKDSSTNGTGYDDGVLTRGQVLELGGEPKVLNFGAGITLAICFNEEQERVFGAAQGLPSAFKKTSAGSQPGGLSRLADWGGKQRIASSGKEPEAPALAQGTAALPADYAASLDVGAAGMSRFRLILTFVAIGMLLAVVAVLLWPLIL